MPAITAVRLPPGGGRCAAAPAALSRPCNGPLYCNSQLKPCSSGALQHRTEPCAARSGRDSPAPPAQVAPGASPSLVFINVSPIEYGHVLLVPRALDNLPQLVGPDTLLLALQFAREAGALGVLARGAQGPSAALPLRGWCSSLVAAQ